MATTNAKPQTDIRQIDFLALRNAGYRGAVFDKDNCLTIPHQDTLVPQLEDAWRECREAFGEENIIIVSNSAGTKFDAGGIQAESVSFHLSVPVLRHDTLKPGYSCIASIRTYFSSLRVPIPDDELVVVGDRIFTDVIMANRMRSGFASSASDASARARIGGPLAIWTNGVWQKESMVMRWAEKRLVDLARKWARHGETSSVGTNIFVRELPPPEPRKTGSAFTKMLNMMKWR
ncbi:mitochondrial PGP phosphatase-domain-containing protein [Suillus fuscotomentosus]|uniref:Mitochondrial PGP phosphatase-domain-containing protein n=1 Tax=Suillus fuscotomentosus TaxID=1912939 RepID=A0AAD4EBR7_9AGAM|nr:mitochondrial PGP phosphatase-domain-containing protein [Suillus fuscotomentosus]KAG1903354.1 mitochondrial PGP phosphatase-domain-containing protein [Suillus fuscotomentosus]